jgi:hypothetical protein
MLRIVETLLTCAALVVALDALAALYLRGTGRLEPRRAIGLGAALCVLAALLAAWTLRDLVQARAVLSQLPVQLALVAALGMLVLGAGVLIPARRSAWLERIGRIGALGSQGERTGVLLVLVVSATLAVMYQNTVQGHDATDRVVNYYVAIFKGRPDAHFEESSRLLVPFLIYAAERALGNLDWALVVVAGLITAFSLLMLYLLCLQLTGSALRAALAALAMALFVPIYIGQLYPVSAPLIFGFYCGLCWSALAGRRAMFVAIGLAGIFQRPELVVCAALFWLLQDKLYLQWRRALLPVAMALAAIVIPLAVKALTATSDTIYFEKIARWACGITSCPGENNLLYLKKDLFLYLPVIAGLLWTRKLDRTCVNMMLALVPYIGLFVLVGDFTEPRLFFPIAAVAIANIVKTAELPAAARHEARS